MPVHPLRRDDEGVRDRPSTEQVRRRYDEMAGNWRLLGITDALLLLNRLRRNQFSGVRGAVLDVACGTGENFPYLERARSVVAFDLSPEMIGEARRRARQLRMDVDLVVGDAQKMPFPDGIFDEVVSGFSTCTFPDHVAALGEMVRVTRPGGRILLVEHGRSSVGAIARRQDRNIERVLARSACRNNRDVLAEIAEAGLTPSVVRTSHLGMLQRVTIDV
jgi:ubiquinone/menaquinone biosynthesis C-methylase UbiE